MARAQAIGHDDRLTLVEHLDELRSRIILSVVAFGVAFALCFWQDALMLDIFNWPLPADKDDALITLSPTEPFFTTVEVAAYGAMVLSLPLILYQLYAFVIPAFSPREKNVVRPYLLAMPLLFLGGIAFAYFVVMPAAISFLLSFNEAEFNTQLRAKEYYGFLGIMTVVLGLLFQMPIALLAITRLGVVTPDQLAENRRYAILAISVVAAALPGGDPVSMLLIMLPLVLLYEASVFLARRFGEAGDVAPSEPAPEGSG
ncbi:MAG: twin-arginine translocase subunit TatC [Solirubrobacterales bacterium]